jgi:predicted nucleotidyltransferase
MQKNDSDIRAFLLAETFRFIDRVAAMPGIKRIAIIGSLTTSKADPKDADILVTVEDDADLTALATASRRLKGLAQSKSKGADIFLANPSGEYIGRICHWRECGPGIRASCDAHHCGQRHYLHDDFNDIKLNVAVVREPTVEVWPKMICREQVPSDLQAYLSRFESGRDKL